MKTLVLDALKVIVDDERWCIFVNDLRPALREALDHPTHGSLLRCILDEYRYGLMAADADKSDSGACGRKYCKALLYVHMRPFSVTVATANLTHEDNPIPTITGTGETH
eukprot:489791-Pleurochrysis_carterae.AAC.1